MGKSEKSRNIIYNARLECQKTLKNSGFWHFCTYYHTSLLLVLNDYFREAAKGLLKISCRGENYRLQTVLYQF